MIYDKMLSGKVLWRRSFFIPFRILFRTLYRMRNHIFIYLERWMQPAQQHGRRLPAARFSRAILILRFLVSDFLADSIQHIHSLRASGVISSHTENAAGAATRISCRSAGIWWTVLPEIFLFIIRWFYQILSIITTPDIPRLTNQMVVGMLGEKIHKS